MEALSPKGSSGDLEARVARLEQQMGQMSQQIKNEATQAAEQAISTFSFQATGAQVSGTGRNIMLTVTPRTGTVNITGVCGEDSTLNFTGTVTIQ